MAEQIDDVVGPALRRFATFVGSGNWRGRENEAVNLFAFDFLISACHEGTVLSHPAQIGIEVAVPQAKGIGTKKQVRKDLVIWSQPRETCWNAKGEPANCPIAILEWKIRKSRFEQHDLNFLRTFSADRPEFVGYAISVLPRKTEAILECARVHRGLVDEKWLLC